MGTLAILASADRALYLGPAQDSVAHRKVENASRCGSARKIRVNTVSAAVRSSASKATGRRRCSNSAIGAGA